MSANAIKIVRLVDAPDRAGATSTIEAIFWENVVVMPTAAERTVFRDLWFGQYLRLDPELIYIAIDGNGIVGGYLVGCLVDPATSPRFTSLAYFQTFADACARFPAHLHINLTAAWRNRGIGGHLIDAFAARVREARLPGFHVVTGATMRNVTFYARIGFREIASTDAPGGRRVLFLGRSV